MYSPTDVQQVVAQIGAFMAPMMVMLGMLWALGFVVARRACENVLDWAGEYVRRQRALRVARRRKSRGASSAPL